MRRIAVRSCDNGYGMFPAMVNGQLKKFSLDRWCWHVHDHQGKFIDCFNNWPAAMERAWEVALHEPI